MTIVKITHGLKIKKRRNRFAIDTGWTCESCTFLNQCDSRYCQACYGIRMPNNHDDNMDAEPSYDDEILGEYFLRIRKSFIHAELSISHPYMALVYLICASEIKENKFHVLKVAKHDKVRIFLLVII